MNHDEHTPAQANPLEGYFEWQVATLMLAYDLAEPIPAGREDLVSERRQRVEQEVRQMVLDLLPQEYIDQPEKDFPPELMMQITRATLLRACQIAGLQQDRG